MKIKTQIVTGVNQALNTSDLTILSRRNFVRKAALTAGAGYAAMVTGSAHAQQQGNRQNAGRTGRVSQPGSDRAAEVLERRINAARQQGQLAEPLWPVNNDEAVLEGFIGNFSKTLPHNDFGEVDPAAYQQLLQALTSGQREDFEVIAAGGNAKLANPRAAYSFALSGCDSHKIDMPAVHALGSKRQAAEAAEVYWMALCRDIPFDDYEIDSTALAAAADLSSFTDFTAPREGSVITPSVLFRGQTPGDLQGGYLSEFLKLDVPSGNDSIAQVYYHPVVGDDYMIDVPAGLRCSADSLRVVEISFSLMRLRFARHVTLPSMCIMTLPIRHI